MARTRAPRQPGDDSFQPTPAKTVAWEPCAWKTHGRPCLMIATLWLQPTGNYEFDKFGQITKVLRPGYCGWHFECLSSPRLSDDYEEFERMQTIWLKRPYCNQFVHHPANYVWEALRGDGHEGERLTVTPCNAHDCWVPDVLGLDRHGPAVSPKDARAKIAEIVKMLSKRMEVNTPPTRRTP
jgi:hypothetical protein